MSRVGNNTYMCSYNLTRVFQHVHTYIEEPYSPHTPIRATPKHVQQEPSTVAQMPFVTSSAAGIRDQLSLDIVI